MRLAASFPSTAPWNQGCFNKLTIEANRFSPSLAPGKTGPNHERNRSNFVNETKPFGTPSSGLFTSRTDFKQRNLIFPLTCFPVAERRRNERKPFKNTFHGTIRGTLP